MTSIILPELGEGIKKATVSYWYYKTGDVVKEGEDLVELTTDKATFNLHSPASGSLDQIIIPEGGEAKVAEVLGIIR